MHCNLLKSTLNVKIFIIIILLKFTVVIEGGIFPIKLIIFVQCNNRDVRVQILIWFHIFFALHGIPFSDF